MTATETPTPTLTPPAPARDAGNPRPPRPRRPRRAPQPARGTCRWLAGSDAAAVLDGTAAIAINDTNYWITAHRDGDRVTGYRLEKWGAGPDGAYDVNLVDGTCTCPDAVYCDRPGGCKHRKAVAAAVGRLGL